MSKQRKEKLQEQLKQEVSDILQNEIKDPGIGFVTVTSVNLSGDYRHAKIFVSIFDNKEKQEETMQTLEKATGFIRSEVAKRVKLRHIPELVFIFDESIEHGDHINKLLKELRQGNDNNNEKE